MTRTIEGCKPWQAALLAFTLAGAGAGVVAGAAPCRAAEAPGRAYELVTPSDKDYNFGETAGNNAVAVAAPDGNGVAFNMEGPLPGSSSGGQQNYYVARRGRDRWTSHVVSPPVNPLPGGSSYPVFDNHGGFSPDLHYGLFLAQDPVLTANAEPGVPELYRRDTNTGAYDLLSLGNPTDAPSIANASATSVAGGSADFSRVVFETPNILLPAANTGINPGAYEWINGTLQYVGILPNGSSAPLSVIGAGASLLYRVEHAVSDDGRRIVFKDDLQQLYVREDAATTVRVSVSRRATSDPNGSGAAQFWGASADVGRVVFTDQAELTNDANTGDDGLGNPTDAGTDLYLYDLGNGGTLQDLSVDTNPADSATGAAVQGVVGVSDDGTYVYFVAFGNLGGAAVSGSPNLYLWHDGSVRYIATLSAADGQDWTLYQSTSAGLTSRVTPDGHYVAFESAASLAGYDNTDAVTGAADTEVYRYDATSDTLVCGSCRPDGARPHGSSTITPPPFELNTTRNLADNGRLFFDSADDLVPQDTNGRTDVYEYADGAPALISTGTSRYDAHFQDASSSGDDVFFSTRAQLVPQDSDDLVDLYDATVGVGFPAPPPDDHCPATLCSGSGGNPAAHDPGLPGSAVLDSSGNVLSIRLPKQQFTIAHLTAAQRKLAARTGRLTVAVSVTAAGNINARLRGRIDGRVATAGQARRVVSRAGNFRLTLRLTHAARRELARDRRLRLRLTVTYSKVSGAKRTTVSLHR